jgi:hypothetical protein
MSGAYLYSTKDRHRSGGSQGNGDVVDTDTAEDGVK